MSALFWLAAAAQLALAVGFVATVRAARYRPKN
jgi:hypothetical protein